MQKIQLPQQISEIVKIGSSQALIDDFLQENLQKKIIFISDKKIWKNCQKFFAKDLLKKFTKILLLENPQADQKNLKKIAEKLADIDLIFALGSGTINDLCKYSSAQKKIPYVVFASAASMNGYLSRNASITVSKHKKTLPATLPNKIFCDLKILKNAPLSLTKAGIGDVLCFYSCYFDWYLSHKILATKFDEKALKISQKKIDFLIKNYQQFSLKDEKFLCLLIELLLISGYAMTMAGGSYPASQSEHMIAHTIEMKYPQIAKNLLHGQMIAVSSLSALKIQGELLNQGLPQVLEQFLSKKNDAKINKNFSGFFEKKLERQCLAEYQKKLSAIKFAKKLDQKSLKKLQKIYMPESKLKQILQHFKIKISAQSLRLSKIEYEGCVAFAKFTRDRFSCLDLFY